MDLLMRRTKGDHFVEEGDKLLAGVALGSLAMNLAGLHVESGIQGESSVSKVFEPVPFGSAGDRGNTGSSRSRACIADFSSTQKTAACVGGFRYKPMIAAAFFSKSGSSLAI